jgi:hypothetical protein
MHLSIALLLGVNRLDIYGLGFHFRATLSDVKTRPDCSLAAASQVGWAFRIVRERIVRASSGESHLLPAVALLPLTVIPLV